MSKTRTLSFIVTFLLCFQSYSSQFNHDNKQCSSALSSTLKSSKPNFSNLVRNVPLISMDSHYKGENEGTYYDSIMKQYWKVHYFSNAEKNNYKLKIQDGIFLNYENKKMESEVDAESVTLNESIFIIDKQNDIYALPFEERGRIHHSSLSGAEPVIFAGTITFSNGYVKKISNHSGHYKPNTFQTLLALYLLKKMGLNLNYMSLEGQVALDIGNTHAMKPSEVQKVLFKLFNLEELDINQIKSIAEEVSKGSK